jgi:hypothetical protein
LKLLGGQGSLSKADPHVAGSDGCVWVLRIWNLVGHIDEWAAAESRPFDLVADALEQRSQLLGRCVSVAICIFVPPSPKPLVLALCEGSDQFVL